MSRLWRDKYLTVSAMTFTGLASGENGDRGRGDYPAVNAVVFAAELDHTTALGKVIK